MFDFPPRIVECTSIGNALHVRMGCYRKHSIQISPLTPLLSFAFSLAFCNFAHSLVRKETRIAGTDGRRGRGGGQAGRQVCEEGSRYTQAGWQACRRRGEGGK